MSYRYAVTATIVALDRSRSDIATGYLRLEATAQKTLVRPDGLTPFRTRRSTVAACRRHYRAAAWRPEVDDRVIIDGEFDESGILIDALAPDLAPPFRTEPIASIAASELARQAETLGSATKSFRQEPGGPLRRIRGVRPYLETDRGTALPAIPHLDIDLADGAMRAWSACAEGRGIVANALTPALEEAIAAMAGLVDVPPQPTVVDHLPRREGPRERSVGPLSERQRSPKRHYRPGGALEDALRKAGLEHSAFEDDTDVPFEPVGSGESAEADAEDSCPF